MSRIRLLLGALAAILTGFGVSAQDPSEENCPRGDKGVFFGPPFVLTYEYPIERRVQEEVLPENDGLFPYINDAT